MRIAEIAPVWLSVPPTGYGGIELVVSRLTEGLVERGHEVTLFASGGSQTSARLVSPMTEPPGLGNDGSTSHEAFHSLSAYRRAEEFDVIHDHTWLGPCLGAMLDGPPVVHTLHGPWDDRAVRHYSLLHDRLHLVAISQAQRESNPSVRYRGIVHNGIDLGAYPVRTEKEDFLLFVGRSCRDKGPERAVEVARRAGMHLKMVVKRTEAFEQDHWNREVEPRLTGDEEILDEVSHEEKVDLLGRATATLFPITWPEPFGLVMIESMACGTPVLATPMGAATEVVGDRRTGFLCETLDDMVEALGRLGRISPEGCRAHVGLRFSDEEMTRGYERIFTQVVERAGRRGALAPAFR
jgi:glycosyltransferase involved in cell wall biosynthesis